MNFYRTMIRLAVTNRLGLGVLIIFLCSIFPAQAWMPGYDRAPARYQVLTVEAHLQMRGEVLEQERNDRLWMEYTVDLQQSRCRILMVKGNERPQNFSQPVIEIFLNDGLGALINHDERIVTIRQQREADAGARLILTAGRIHRGHSLQDIFSASQDRLRSDDESGARALDIEAPYFDAPVVIVYDEQDRPVRIEDGDETFLLTWTQSSDDFAYVSHVEYSLVGDGITILRHETVRETSWSDNLPNSVFEYETPQGYETRDFRNLMQPPSTLPR